MTAKYNQHNHRNLKWVKMTMCCINSPMSKKPHKICVGCNISISFKNCSKYNSGPLRYAFLFQMHMTQNVTICDKAGKGNWIFDFTVVKQLWICNKHRFCDKAWHQRGVHELSINRWLLYKDLNWEGFLVSIWIKYGLQCTDFVQLFNMIHFSAYCRHVA